MYQRIPSKWTAPGRSNGSVRLLIEDPDPVLALSDFESYREAGIEVALCSGPGPDQNGRCPVLTRGRCPILSGADVVLHHLDSATGVAKAIRESAVKPRLVTIGPAGADLAETAPVSSRIRAVIRSRYGSIL